MDDNRAESGESREDWAGLEARRRRDLTVGVIVGLVLVALAVALALARCPSGVLDPVTTRPFTPAEPTAEPTWTVVATYTPAGGSAETSSGGSGTAPSPDDAASADSGPGDGATGGESSVLRAPALAYRLDGMLHVIAEDGSGTRLVARSASGAFALSPDGRVLAWVDATSGALTLTEVASGEAHHVGSALQTEPVWLPDSATVVYVAPGPQVVRVDADGSGASTLSNGSMTAVSPDGSMAAVLSSAGDEVVLLGADGSEARIPVDAPVAGLACDVRGVYVGVGPDGAGRVSLLFIDAITGAERVLVASARADRPVSFGALLLSPDGRTLVYAERGDDGYSRLFAIDPAGGAPRPLSPRRDCYALAWSADGTALGAIEGNAVQGESTALVLVSAADGAARVVVPGAGL